ncbi:MAG TPA: DMT family transporter [Dongiaceae bacterium]|nr:DMT family transporter [Dongiaceae bacterium]
MQADLASLRNNPRRAVAYSLAAAFLLTTMDAVVKWLTTDYSVVQIAFLRYAIGLFIAIGLAGASPAGLGGLVTRRPASHLWRSAFNIATMITFYLAMRAIPLANAVCISLASPIFMTLFSIPMLREKVPVDRWVAVFLGFVGIALIVQPAPDAGVGTGALLALVSAVTWSLTLVSSRRLSSSESSHTILFYYALTVVISLGGTLLLFPSLWHLPMNARDIGFFALTGLLGSFGQFFLNQAYRYGPISLLAPFEYSGMIWAVLFDIAIWSNFPSLVMVLGALIVIGCCLHIARSSSRSKRQEAEQELSS